jgi:hypothetical protein
VVPSGAAHFMMPVVAIAPWGAGTARRATERAEIGRNLFMAKWGVLRVLFRCANAPRTRVDGACFSGP